MRSELGLFGGLASSVASSAQFDLVVLLEEPVEHSLVPIHALLSARDPVLDDLDVQEVLDAEMLVIFALPDDVQVEKGFEDGTVHEFVPCIEGVSGGHVSLALSPNKLLQHLHHCKVYFLRVEHVPEKRVHEKLVKSVFELPLQFEERRIVGFQDLR